MQKLNMDLKHKKKYWLNWYKKIFKILVCKLICHGDMYIRKANKRRNYKMSNMSYCRFHNTLIDLNDCIGALENRDISSDEEKRSALKMIKKFLGYCMEEDIIEDFDEDRIKEIIDECSEQD